MLTQDLDKTLIRDASAGDNLARFEASDLDVAFKHQDRDVVLVRDDTPSLERAVRKKLDDDIALLSGCEGRLLA